MSRRPILISFLAAFSLAGIIAGYGFYAWYQPLDHKVGMMERRALVRIQKNYTELKRSWLEQRNEIGQAMAETEIWVQEKVATASQFYQRHTIDWASKTSVVAVTPKEEFDPPSQVTLSQIKHDIQARAYAEMQPSAGVSEPSKWEPEAQTLTIETVLVPRQFTVISSSQDGKIADIPFDNGDAFQKGDILVRYDCADLEAEASMADMQKTLANKKREGVDRLFKLDVISDIDRIGVESESKQADAKVKVYQARMDSCVIRAAFSGRVTKRLANPGEYTRTDRVLMEVASQEPLQSKFLLPSKWLRWVNTGAPVEIKLNETDRSYSAIVTRIYGEIDPVSQSIQMVATLDNYPDPLLPGMSGKVTLDIGRIRDAGIQGYLQSPNGL